MWSAGISLFTTAPRWERIKRVLFNPGIIAVELGLLRMLFEPDLPLVAVSAIHALGECTTPLAMIIVGMILAEIPLKNFLSSKALLLSAIRQLFMPLVLLLSLHGLHIDPLLTAVATILTGMPIGLRRPSLLQNMGPMRNLLLPVSLRQP
ncbi:AEC family transporter [Acidaminococcus intestini]|nr:AEC family transporter [Acidaminococcus intestini]